MRELNPRQREAATTTEGHVLVLAGAGSGKTRVITERIVYLIEKRRISPARILAFTFTNKAAGEMRRRVERLIDRAELPFWIGTFHATGVRILRREAKHIGFGNNFAIFDEDDSLSLVKDIIKSQGWRLDEHPPSLVRNRISRWKTSLVPPGEALEKAGDIRDELYAKIYEKYCRRLKTCNAFDFDDLITKVVELFAANPKVKERYARQFRYVMVDEFQDTNTIQMVMIDALASVHRNLFVVGDEDQAIYGWRGATVENILQFDRLYPDTVTILLEENYRSTNRILKSANELIANNSGRKGKTLWSQKGEGDPIRLYHADDEMEEANSVREAIIGLIRSGYARKEIAVLYRTHAQSRALENAMRRGGMPYQIIGGVRFYERKEIKDLLGYLKLINNPLDDVNFKRVINVPRRGIGQVSLERIERSAGGEGLLLSLRNEETLSALPGQQRKQVEEFSKMIALLQLLAREASANDILAEVIERTAYREHLRGDPKTAQTRLENIEELLVETQRFILSAKDARLSSFLEEIALISDIDMMKTEETVALMTLHNSKGLEYRAVLIAGIEEGLLPHYSSFDDDEELEEERRLFYVGMTRAKERLYLFSAANRLQFGSWTGNRPSRFLREIPMEHVQLDSGTGMARAGEDLFRAIDSRPVTQEEETVVQSKRFYAGAVVKHPTYGKGTIRKVEGAGKEMRVTVYFPGKGEKKFMAVYAPFQFLR